MIHVHSQVCDICRSVVVEKRVCLHAEINWVGLRRICPHHEIKWVGLKREFVQIMK